VLSAAFDALSTEEIQEQSFAFPRTIKNRKRVPTAKIKKGLQAA
jgi:hypothetical protein